MLRGHVLGAERSDEWPTCHEAPEAIRHVSSGLMSLRSESGASKHPYLELCLRLFQTIWRKPQWYVISAPPVRANANFASPIWAGSWKRALFLLLNPSPASTTCSSWSSNVWRMLRRRTPALPVCPAQPPTWELRLKMAWVWITTLPLASCVNLGKFPNLSVTQFPYL